MQRPVPVLLVMPLAPIFLTVSAQLPERPPFQTLMDIAKIRKVITDDTAAGPTRVLITAMTETPADVFTYSPGGEGTLLLGTMHREHRPPGANVSPSIC